MAKKQPVRKQPAKKATPARKPTNPGKVRNAKTGQYAPTREAKSNPGGTVTEHDKKRKK